MGREYGPKARLALCAPCSFILLSLTHSYHLSASYPPIFPYDRDRLAVGSVVDLHPVYPRPRHARARHGHARADRQPPTHIAVTRWRSVPIVAYLGLSVIAGSPGAALLVALSAVGCWPTSGWSKKRRWWHASARRTWTIAAACRSSSPGCAGVADGCGFGACEEMSCGARRAQDPRERSAWKLRSGTNVRRTPGLLKR